MQVPTLATEEELVLELLTAHGILVHPGYFFDFPRESFLVVSLLTPPQEFADGVTGILRHFDCRVGGHAPKAETRRRVGSAHPAVLLHLDPQLGDW